MKRHTPSPFPDKMKTFNHLAPLSSYPSIGGTGLICSDKTFCCGENSVKTVCYGEKENWKAVFINIADTLRRDIAGCHGFPPFLSTTQSQGLGSRRDHICLIPNTASTEESSWGTATTKHPSAKSRARRFVRPLSGSRRYDRQLSGSRRDHICLTPNTASPEECCWGIATTKYLSTQSWKD